MTRPFSPQLTPSDATFDDVAEVECGYFRPRLSLNLELLAILQGGLPDEPFGLQFVQQHLFLVFDLGAGMHEN